MIAGCWLLDLPLQQLAVLVNYQVAAGKKFWTFKDTDRMFCNSRCFEDFAGFPGFLVVSIQEFGNLHHFPNTEKPQL